MEIKQLLSHQTFTQVDTFHNSFHSHVTEAAGVNLKLWQWPQVQVMTFISTLKVKLSSFPSLSNVLINHLSLIFYLFS